MYKRQQEQDVVPKVAAGGLSHPTSSPDDTPSHSGRRLAPLMLGALGIVFGDIGTSPLYSMQTVFSIDQHAVAATPANVYGCLLYTSRCV